MKASDSSEAFTHFVINKIKPDIRHTLTKEQLKEIKSAISAGSLSKKHPVDIRGIIPLFYSRFYFIFLLGRDRRYKIIRSEGIRRKETDIIASITFFIFLISPLLILGFFALYFAKTDLGIDLFPQLHLFDLLNY